MIGVGGCSWFNGATMRSQSPEEPEPAEPHTRLVGDLAVPTGVQPARVEAVGLVTGLHGTGSDPGPSPQRAALLEEMQARDVANPNTVLASGNVSLVLIQGLSAAGHPERRPLRHRRPRPFAKRHHQPPRRLSAGNAACGNGRAATTKCITASCWRWPRDRCWSIPRPTPRRTALPLCRGRIPGGGVLLESRPLGLVLLPEHQNVANSSRVANAVNKRFHTFQNGIQTGVAKAKTDEFIELAVHPRYKDNIARYVQVVRALPMAESASERMERIAALQRQLLDPETAADAALQLEALGPEGVDALLKGIQSKDTEVRFYAAEALAYLDRREAAEPLGQIARDQPAFRVFALTALSAMQDFAAYDQLRELLSVPSAETRYGAFRALWTMNDKDPLVKGEMLGDQFHYHVLDVAGPPMIHVTRNRLAEIVVFGRGQKLLTPLALNAGNEIMITSSRRRRNLREQVFRRRRRPEADRLDAGGRRDPGDRRTGRNLPRRGAGPGRGQELRRARLPVRGRCLARGRADLRPACRGRARRRRKPSGNG